MKLIKNGNNIPLLSGLIASSVMLMVGFQNCSPVGFNTNFETAELGLASTQLISTPSRGSAAAGTSVETATEPNTNRTQTPVIAAPVIAAPVIAAPVIPAPVAVDDCHSEVAIAEWNSPAKIQELQIRETSMPGLMIGQQTFPSAGGFRLTFLGVKPSVHNAPKMSSGIPSGFEIKFTSVRSNNSFYIAQNDYIPALDSGILVSDKNGGYTTTSINHTNRYTRIAAADYFDGPRLIPGRSSMEFIISRDVYDRNPGLSEVNVELFCKGALVASKVVDFSSNENNVLFKSYYEKTDFKSMYGLTTSSGKKVSYFKKNFDGWIQPFCPATAKPGQNVTCTVQMSKISSFKWSYLGSTMIHDASLDNKIEVSFKAPAAGSRMVGVEGITHDGRVVRGSLYIVVK